MLHSRNLDICYKNLCNPKQSSKGDDTKKTRLNLINITFF